MEMNKQIQRLELFQGVSSETMNKIMKLGKVMKFPKGKQLMRMKEEITSVYVQLSGKSIIYNLTGTGKRKILFVCGKGMLLNEHIFNVHVSTVYCETIESSEILVFPVEEFVKLMAEDFELTRKIGMAQEKKIWRLGHQLKNTTSSISMERRLAAKLWKLSKDFGTDTGEGREIGVDLSITFLADMVGAPRETISRICKSFVESGVIMMNKKRIIIRNPERVAMLYKSEQRKLIDVIYKHNKEE